MQKNVAGQKWVVFAFDETDNTAVTGDAANITGNLRIDGGAANPIDDTNPAELEDGYYIFDITQAESNGDYILIAPQSSTADVQVIGVPGAIWTTAPNFNALGIESDGDITQVDSLTGHTVQTGDNYAIVNSGTYGNAQLVRSTTPANTLDISATGEAGLDFDNIKDATGAHTLTNITIPITTDVTNQVTADVTAISGDTTAADNLELQYDGTGLTGDTFPSTQAQLSNIANVGSAVNKSADSYTLTTGTQTANSYTDTAALDGVRHTHTDTAGQLDLYYEFIIGGGSPSSVTITGKLTGVNDDLEMYAYDWVATTWVQIGVMNGTTSSTNAVFAYDLFVSMVGTGADIGKVRIRFTDGAYTLTSATLYVDQIFVSYSQVSGDYALGAIWVDTNASNTNTTPGLDGISTNPVSTWAAALTLSTSLNIKNFQIVNGSSITLSANSDSYNIHGNRWDLNLNGQSIEGVAISGADLVGTGTATVTHPVFSDCHIAAATLPPSHFDTCGIGDSSGTFTGGSAGQYVFNGCYSLVPGPGKPNFVFSGLGAATGINNRGWTGGSNYTLDSDCTISHEVLAGGGQTFTTGGGDVELRGICRSVNAVLSGAGTVQFVGITGVVTLSGAATTTVNLYGVSSSLSDTSSGTTVNDYTTSYTDINSILTDTAALDSRLTAARATYLDNLNIGGDVAAAATALTNATWTDVKAGYIDVAISSRSDFDESTDPVELLDTGGSAGTSAEELVDDVWDEILTGATHNVPTSSGRRLRDIASDIVLTGTSPDTGGTANTLIRIELDATALAVDGSYDPGIIIITGGTGVGQARQIFEYDGTNKYAYINRDWKVIPDNTSDYTIVGHSGDTHINEGLVTGGTSNTITLNTLASSVNDTYVGQTAFLTSGTGQDQSAIITAYNGSTRVATIQGTWNPVPVNAATVYSILPQACSSLVEMKTQVDTALSDIGLDHMVSASVAGADVTDNSIMAKIASKSATADWDSFNNTTDSLEALSDSGGGDATAANQTTIIANQDLMKGSGFLTATDSLEAIRNRGDSAWLTGGGLSGSNSVTLTFQDELSANVVEVAVEIWDEPGTTFYEKTFSNSNGQTTHNIDDGVYTIKAHKAGYRFENTSLTLPAELTKTITATSYTPSPPTDPALCKIYTYLKYNDGSIPGTVESTLRVKNIPYAVSNNLFSQFEMAGTYDSSTGLLYWEVQREAKCTIHIDQFLNDNITIPDQELEEIGDLI